MPKSALQLQTLRIPTLSHEQTRFVEGHGAGFHHFAYLRKEILRPFRQALREEGILRRHRRRYRRSRLLRRPQHDREHDVKIFQSILVIQYAFVCQHRIGSPRLAFGDAIRVHLETVGVRDVEGDGGVHPRNDTIVDSLLRWEGTIVIACTILLAIFVISKTIFLMNGSPYLFGADPGVSRIPFRIEPQIHDNRRIIIFACR
mmetsp:Transcript_16460/g.39397  ORF Transcript_16460/g.39397 Transcript_16460/m.39397 type:complete len:202 (+) Transcript_16460:262-867(+)